MYLFCKVIYNLLHFIEDQLQGWEAKLLSQAGREALLKAVI